MSQQIRRFGIGQTAKVLGALYGLLGLVFVPFIFLATVMAPGEFAFGLGYAIIFPVLYAVIGFVMTAIGCALYNFVAGMVGGIEVELGTSEGS
jgi:hypothetical protein